MNPPKLQKLYDVSTVNDARAASIEACQSDDGLTRSYPQSALARALASGNS